MSSKHIGKPIHPIISRDWNGQMHFKRTTNTRNLQPVASPFRWYERLIGRCIVFVADTFQTVGKHL